MAGAGYKLFNTGDVLTAAQVNTYLNEQTVMVFASSTARTTALSGVLAEGMVSYLQDTNAVEVYNGSAWVNVGNAGDITEVQAGVGISIASGTGPIPVITNSSTDLITTAGDILYGTAADTMARLGIGTAGQVLKVNSGATAPEWGAAGGTSPVLTVSKYSSNFSTSSTTFTDMTGYSITRTPVSATNKIEIKLTFTFTISQGTAVSVKLFAGATSLLENAYYEPYDGGEPKTLTMIGYAENVAASSTVFKAQIKVGAGTITVYGTNSGYASNFSTLEIY